MARTELGEYQTLLELEIEEPELIHGPDPLRYGFVQTPPALQISPGALGGADRIFGPGLVSLDVQGRRADLYSGTGGTGGAGFTVALDAFPIEGLRRKGVRIQRIRGKVWWWRPGQTMAEAFLLWRGEVRGPKIDDARGTFTARLDASTRERDAQFPPGFIGDEGRFPAPGFSVPPESSLRQPMMVMYGTPDEAPVYAISDDTVVAGDVRYLLAGHRVEGAGLGPFGAVQLVKNISTTFLGPVGIATDGRGQTYSYVDVPFVQVTSDDAWVSTGLQGYVDAAGRTITRLGDVLRHLVDTYAKESFFELDWERIGASTTELNRFEFSGVFNSVQTISMLRVLRSRFEGQFPVVFGFATGKFGWDYVGVPSGNRPVAEIVWGQNAHSRGEFVPETPIGLARSRYEVLYSNSGVAAGTTKALRIDETTNPAARGAFLKWGLSPTERLSIPDVDGNDSAFLLAEDAIRRLAGVRMRQSYQVADPNFLKLPLFSRIWVTDPARDWTQKPFLIEGLTPARPGFVSTELISEHVV